MEDPKQHWERIYSTKQPMELSWTQERPQTSLDFIHSANLSKEARIIDIGGGDSRLVDHLLDEGYENITVLDISESALARSRERLGSRASKVNWILSDIIDFSPVTEYDFWHDRATFHFLTHPDQIHAYMATARRAVRPRGVVTIGTFSVHGPRTCSGLRIQQYSEDQLTTELSDGFVKIRCITEVHLTPFHTKQEFLFCSFRRQLRA